MKVLVINCGSSSLKYQLIDMDGEKVLCKGLCERIGMESSMITHEANGHKATTPAIFPTHTEAFAEVVKKMTTGEGKCINDVSEIDAIGHRVVHGGEKFKSSCLITDEVINTLRELSPLAPLHNPAGILGIEAISSCGEDLSPALMAARQEMECSTHSVCSFSASRLPLSRRSAISTSKSSAFCGSTSAGTARSSTVLPPKSATSSPAFSSRGWFSSSACFSSAERSMAAGCSSSWLGTLP